MTKVSYQIVEERYNFNDNNLGKRIRTPQLIME